MSRHVILSAFVNLGLAAATLYPRDGDPRPLRRGERVDPPGEVELTDEAQAERLIAAKAIRAEGDSAAGPGGPGSKGGKGMGGPGDDPGQNDKRSVSHGTKGKGGRKAGAASGGKGTGTAPPRSTAAGDTTGGAGGNDGGRGGDGAESPPGGGGGDSEGGGGSPA